MKPIPTQPTRHVYVADDHPMILESFCNVFSALDKTICVKGFIEFSALENALLKGNAPDLIVLDFSMPGLGSVEAIESFFYKHLPCRVAVLSGHVNSKLATNIIQLGCCGYIPKTLSPKAVYHAVLLMIAGGCFLPDFLTAPSPAIPWNVISDVVPMGLPSTQDYGLTSREIEVLRALARGLQNKEIARELNIAEVTIKLHLRHAFAKLKVTNRIGAVRAVMEGALGK